MSRDDLPLPPEGITYYQLLGVSEDASGDDIQDAYRQLIKLYHPDLWNHWAAGQVSKRLKKAYNVLSDPRKRQRYNREGHKEYTGDEMASVTEMEEWINDVTEIIDVHNPASVSEVSENEQGVIDVDDEFQSGETDLSATDVFDQIDEDIETTSFDEIQQETESEGDTDNSTYGSDEIVDDIRLRDDKQPNDDTNKSFEERVKEKSESHSRSSDPTTNTEVTNQSTSATPSSVERETTREPETDYKEKAVKTVHSLRSFKQNYLSDDVVFRAVRRAWFIRSLGVIGLTTAIVVLSELLATIGLSSVSGFLPTFSSLGSPQTILVVMLATIVVFVADQIKTEQDSDRGEINSAAEPASAGALTLLINGGGAILVTAPVYTGYDPFEIIHQMIQGTLPENVWVDAAFSIGPLAGGAVVNGLIAIVASSALVLGYLFGIGTITRFAWYARYAGGYRVLPLWWDLLIGIPVFAGLISVFTGASPAPLVAGVKQWAIETFPEIISQIGTGEVLSPIESGVIITLASPFCIGIILYGRVFGERLGDAVLNQTDSSD